MTATVTASDVAADDAGKATADRSDAPPRPPRTPRAGASRRYVLAVLAAILVGLAIRAAIGLTDDAPSTDETAYLRSGLSWVAGDGFGREGEPELHFPPLMPGLLGLTAQVVGDPHTATVVLTCLAGTVAILPLSLLGRRLGGPSAGVATAWIAALAPGLTTTMVNNGAGSEAEYVLLLVSAVWFVVSAADRTGGARLARLAAGGALVGLAYLTRPEGLFAALPLGVAVLALAWRSAAAAAVPAVDVRSRLVPFVRRSAVLGLAFGLPLLACIAPYATYLHAHTGTWELSAKTQDVSIEAWAAVAESDRETRDRELWSLDETGLGFDEERTSLPALAMDDPGGFAHIFATNVGSLVGVVTAPQGGRVLAWALLPLPVWGLAVYGAWRYRRRRTLQVTLAVAALPLVTVLAFFVQSRYLLLAVALATVPAGAGLAALGRWRRAGALVTVGLLVLSTAQGFYGSAGWWHPRDHGEHRAMGEWIAANSPPDTRLMSRSMIVEFYADRPTMVIPYADMDDILAYGRHFGARYLVVDSYTVRRLRPQLEVLWEPDPDVDGLRLAHEETSEGRTIRVFELDPVPPVPDEMGATLSFVGDG